MLDSEEGRSADYWRGMAAKARAMADGLITEANRERMLEIAENYDRLAEQAEREQERASRVRCSQRKRTVSGCSK